MSLKDIFCQDKAIGILQKAYSSGKFAHAYIFAGTDGVGKYKTAREWGKLLLCEDVRNEGGLVDSCGECKSCKLFEAGSHPDFNHVYKELIEFTKDGKDKKTPLDLPIDVIREFLIEKAPIRPIVSQRKVFVVSEAEKLNTSSQNALLKCLEEPPEYCSIILICTRLEKLFPTIKSRCQTIRFLPVDKERIADKLGEMGLSKEASEYFARLGQGSLGTACQWAKLESSGAELYETKKTIVKSISDYELGDSLELAKEFLDESKRIAEIWGKGDEATSKTDINRRSHKTLVQIIISALNDAMKFDIGPEMGVINFDQKSEIKKLAKLFDSEQLAEKIEECYKTMRWIESAVNEKLIFEHLLLNIADSVTISGS